MIADDYFLHKHLQKRCDRFTSGTASMSELHSCRMQTHSCDTKAGDRVEGSVNSEIRNALRKCAPVRCAAPTALYRVFKSTLKCQIIQEQVSLCLIPGPNWSRQLKSKNPRSQHTKSKNDSPALSSRESLHAWIFRGKGGTVFHAFRVFTCSGAVRVIQISQYSAHCCGPSLLVFQRSCPHPRWAALRVGLSHAAVALLPVRLVRLDASTLRLHTSFPGARGATPAEDTGAPIGDGEKSY